MATVQRGMPRLSRRQVAFCMTLPAQQFALALHDWLCRRQMPPAGVQALPLSQRPIGLSPSLTPACIAEHSLDQLVHDDWFDRVI